MKGINFEKNWGGRVGIGFFGRILRLSTKIRRYSKDISKFRHRKYSLSSLLTTLSNQINEKNSTIDIFPSKANKKLCIQKPKSQPKPKWKIYE